MVIDGSVFYSLRFWAVFFDSMGEKAGDFDLGHLYFGFVVRNLRCFRESERGLRFTYQSLEV